VAQKCLKPDDWLLDHIQEELAFMRGRICGDSRSCAAHHCAAQYIPELRGASFRGAMRELFQQTGLIYDIASNPRSKMIQPA
jgi:hypothetical protein